MAGPSGLLLVLALLWPLACRQVETRTARGLSAGALGKIAVGMSPDAVVTVLGEPLSRSGAWAVDDGQRWIYSESGYSESRAPSVLGHMRTERGHDCEVLFKEGRLFEASLSLSRWRLRTVCRCSVESCPPDWFDECLRLVEEERK